MKMPNLIVINDIASFKLWALTIQVTKPLQPHGDCYMTTSVSRCTYTCLSARTSSVSYTCQYI